MPNAKIPCDWWMRPKTKMSYTRRSVSVNSKKKMKVLHPRPKPKVHSQYLTFKCVCVSDYTEAVAGIKDCMHETVSMIMVTKKKSEENRSK